MFHRHEFLHGPDLEKEIFEVFSSANRMITIVSPYIKLYSKLTDTLGIPLKNKNISLRILFGKNFKWTKEDVEFIKKFPNVVVKHSESLHAKLYANERLAISTSMNLLETSFKNNYETGVLIEYDSEVVSFLKRYIITTVIYYAIAIPLALFVYIIMSLITFNFNWFEKDKLTDESKEYVNELFYKCDNVIFEKKTSQSKSFLKFKKQNPEQTVIIDRFSEFTQTIGFCIRSGVQIEFNPNQPYSKEKYYEWVKEGGNRNQRENYCHRTGKHSNGETSINNPTLYNS